MRWTAAGAELQNNLQVYLDYESGDIITVIQATGIVCSNYITLSHFSNPSCSKLTSRKCLENTTVLFCLFSYCLKDHQAAGGHATCSHCLLPESTRVRGGIGALVINRQQLILMTKNKE